MSAHGWLLVAAASGWIAAVLATLTAWAALDKCAELTLKTAELDAEVHRYMRIGRGLAERNRQLEAQQVAPVLPLPRRCP